MGSSYRNHNKLRSDGPLGSYVDLAIINETDIAPCFFVDRLSKEERSIKTKNVKRTITVNGT